MELRKHSDDLLRDVLAYWRQGLSGSQIASRLNTTRNVIMGLLHRARKAKVIDYRDDYQRHHAKRVSLSKKKQADPVSVSVDITPVSTEGLTLFELQPHHCRWANSEPEPRIFLFCGAQVKPGSSYCAEHHALVFVPPRKKGEAK